MCKKCGLNSISGVPHAQNVTFEESLTITSELLNMSESISSYGGHFDYSGRIEAFSQFLDMKKGFVQFAPVVRPNLLDKVLPMLQAVRREIVNKHEDAYRQWLLADSGEHEEKLRKQRQEYINQHEIISEIMTYLTVDDIVNNTVPAPVMEWAKANNIKGFASPKLSKWLAPIAGEKSDLMKYWTNQRPTRLVIGTNDGYRITFSILPHHIAGMSYYGSYNHGGERWNGMGGTSCQDVKRNGNGEAIFSVPASLQDGTIGIAFLSYAGQADIETPVYEARAIVRVVPVNKDQAVLVMCRVYTNSAEHGHMLIEGMKNYFSNRVLVASELSNQGAKGYSKIVVDGINARYDYVYTYDCEECSDGRATDECGECGGSGWAWETCECGECNGSGYVDVTCYDCDGAGCEECEGGLLRNMPCCGCDGSGEIEDECECYACSGSGLVNTECTYCDGNGYREHEDTACPYVDDHFIRYSYRYDEVTFTIPNMALERLGIPVPTGA